MQSLMVEGKEILDTGDFEGENQNSGDYFLSPWLIPQPFHGRPGLCSFSLEFMLAELPPLCRGTVTKVTCRLVNKTELNGTGAQGPVSQECWAGGLAVIYE